MKPILVTLAALVFVSASQAQQTRPTSPQAGNFIPYEYNIPMRDGVKLYTIAWVPKSISGKSPMIMERTCYGAGSPQSGVRVRNKWMGEANYIFIFQDVRGKGKE